MTIERMDYMNVRQVSMFVALAAVWGASFLFVRVAVPALGPVVVAEGRVLLAALALLGYVYVTRGRPSFTRPLRSYMVLGALNAAAHFGLMAFAAERLPASLTAIIVATMPLWSVPVVAVWFGEKPSGGALVGLLAGVLGVALVVGATPQGVNAGFLLAVGAALLSALAGALGGNYARVAFSGEGAMAQTIGQQLCAGALLLPLVAVAPSSQTPSATQLFAVLALALLSTGFAYLIYFRLIAEIGATKTLSVEFLVPVFASLWGVLFLGEKLTASAVAGGIVILIGCALVSGWEPGFLFRRKQRRDP